jgi:hypothetical protein
LPHAEANRVAPFRRRLAKDAFLFLWITGPFLALGAHLFVMQAWGFTPSAIGFVWAKLNPNAPELFQGICFNLLSQP